jgi:trans-2,3-dihydro-3-hydroxyanthranilate isomerase
MTTIVDLRVFCVDGGGGNPLGVVYSDKSARTLSKDACLRTTSASGHPEVVFASVAEWHSRRWLQARIFTPKEELSFAGHPLVGLAAHFSSEKKLHEPWKIRVAATEVFAWAEGDFGWVRVPPPPLAPGPKDIFPVLSILRVDALDISPRMPVARGGYGNPYLIIAFADPDRLIEMEPDLEAMADSDDTKYGLYCFAIRGGDVTARFFAPGLGIDEDSGTGSAAVALAVFLSRHWRLAPRDFTITQGHRTGRLCRIFVRRPETGIELGGRVFTDGTREL